MEANLAGAVIEEEFNGGCGIGGRDVEGRTADRDDRDMGGEELGSRLSACLKCGRKGKEKSSTDRMRSRNPGREDEILESGL